MKEVLEALTKMGVKVFLTEEGKRFIEEGEANGKIEAQVATA